MAISEKILNELVYERVRASVNLCQLVILEQDLDRSIERVFDSDPCITPRTREGLARSIMEEAWRRLEQEWDSLRRQLETFDAPPDDDPEDPDDPAPAMVNRVWPRSVAES